MRTKKFPPLKKIIQNIRPIRKLQARNVFRRNTLRKRQYGRGNKELRPNRTGVAITLVSCRKKNDHQKGGGSRTSRELWRYMCVPHNIKIFALGLRARFGGRRFESTVMTNAKSRRVRNSNQKRHRHANIRVFY